MPITVFLLLYIICNTYILYIYIICNTYISIMGFFYNPKIPRINDSKIRHIPLFGCSVIIIVIVKYINEVIK